MNNLDIWILQTGEVLPISKAVRKMRTTLIAENLMKRGHNVLWWSSAFEHQRKSWIARHSTIQRLDNRLRIFLLRGLGYKKNISIKRYIDHWLRKNINQVDMSIVWGHLKPSFFGYIAVFSDWFHQNWPNFGKPNYGACKIAGIFDFI